MKRALTVRRIGKTAGTIVLGLIAIDLVATAATAILAWGFFQK
jgi:hypothetical protein